GLKSALRWMKNPVSEKGATQVARVKLALGGPNVLQDIEEMRKHPIGKRLLEERPDLGATLEMDNLATMPEGSFGRELHKILDHPDTIPGFLLAGLAFRDGFFDSIEMTEEARWFLERSFFEHDASHVISDYATDLSGEALNIYFTMGYGSEMPKWLAFANPFGLVAFRQIPKVGVRAWAKHLSLAFERGRKARHHFPPHCIPYEELLPKPIEEVQAFLGIDPMPEGWTTADWLAGNKKAEEVVSGFGENEKADPEGVKLIQAAVDAGVPWRDFMRASDEARDKVLDIVRQDGSLEDMMGALG
ncbi:MAG: Coq4 family protein, partial [Alphaproteobacteria bacterium]